MASTNTYAQRLCRSIGLLRSEGRLPMSVHRDLVFALSARSDELILKSLELARDSDRIRNHAQALRKKMRDLQREREMLVKKTA